MIGIQVAHDVMLQTEECCDCGIVFAMPASLQRRARESSQQYFYCPNGHSQHYSISEVQRLRDKLAEQTREATRQSERALAAEKRATETQQKLSSLKKRVKAGVCPCCKRSFQNLRRHIGTKHPDYPA